MSVQNLREYPVPPPEADDCGLRLSLQTFIREHRAVIPHSPTETQRHDHLLHGANANAAERQLKQAHEEICRLRHRVAALNDTCNADRALIQSLTVRVTLHQREEQLIK